MRGKIIHYNASDGKGLVAAAGQQFAFQIGQWRSDSAPAVNQTVELEFGEDGTLQSLAKVADEILLREKASELAGRLGGVARSRPTPLVRPRACKAGSHDWASRCWSCTQCSRYRPCSCPT